MIARIAWRKLAIFSSDNQVAIMVASSSILLANLIVISTFAYSRCGRRAGLRGLAPPGCRPSFVDIVAYGSRFTILRLPVIDGTTFRIMKEKVKMDWFVCPIDGGRSFFAFWTESLFRRRKEPRQLFSGKKFVLPGRGGCSLLKVSSLDGGQTNQRLVFRWATHLPLLASPFAYQLCESSLSLLSSLLFLISLRDNKQVVSLFAHNFDNSPLRIRHIVILRIRRTGVKY